ncbi:MAG: DUF3990 domain-containing protein [Coriobacteriales bacterium]|nr:DUF3990 domain-containing protein [Coriobacteriales bacterium]
MQLREGLELYHGSYTKVPNPDLGKCARFKDFGRGFYLTTSLEQARSFSKLSARKAVDRRVPDADSHKAFVSRFVVEGTDFKQLRVLEFEDADTAWLRCVVAHRRRRSFPELVEQLAPFDVIVGKIANDQTNITLALYMDGVFGAVGSAEAERACVTQLLPNRLRDQYCFRSERALKCLRFAGSETVWM